MGLVESIRRLSSCPEPGEPGRQQGRPRPGGPKPRPAGHPEAQTLEEALTFINVLYKSGRMDELAALLRQHPVFREAWLRLQQSAPTGLAKSKGINLPPGRIKPDERGNLPIPSPQNVTHGQEPPKSKEPAKHLKAASEPGNKSAAVPNPETDAFTHLSGQLSYLLTRALQVYQSQLHVNAQEQDTPLRINLRV